ncbi:MAG: hypothetical protein RLZZ92_767 [Actinomycetota bacterium]
MGSNPTPSARARAVGELIGVRLEKPEKREENSRNRSGGALWLPEFFPALELQ